MRRLHNAQILGIILILLGIVFLLNQFDIPVFALFWPLVIILVGVYLIYRGHAHNKVRRDNLISEFKLFGDTRYTEYRSAADNIDISYLIGEIELNLTNAQFSDGTNLIELHTIIGDIKLILPPGMAYEAAMSSIIGDLRIGEKRDEGIINSIYDRSDDYDTASRRVRVTCRAVIGDVKVRFS